MQERSYLSSSRDKSARSGAEKVGMDERLESLEKAVAALTGYVPVQELKEGEGWKTLEDQVLKTSTKVC